MRWPLSVHPRCRVAQAAALGVLAIALGGCAALPTVFTGLASGLSAMSWVERQLDRGRAARPDAGPPAASGEADAYRQGIRDALAQVRRGGGLAVTAPAEPPRVTYVGPLIEEVWVPAQVVGGLLIPAHREWVVVRPGYWQVGGQPLPVGAGAPARPPAVVPAVAR